MGVGAGFVYSTGSLKLRKAVPVQDANGTYGEGELNGKANGYGFNAGIYFQASEKISLGISYRSRVKVKVNDGNAKFTPTDKTKHDNPIKSEIVRNAYPEIVEKLTELFREFTAFTYERGYVIVDTKFEVFQNSK